MFVCAWLSVSYTACSASVSHTRSLCVSHTSQMSLSHTHHASLTYKSRVSHTHIMCLSHTNHVSLTHTSCVSHIQITCLSHTNHVSLTNTSRVSNTQITCVPYTPHARDQQQKSTSHTQSQSHHSYTTNKTTQFRLTKTILRPGRGLGGRHTVGNVGKCFDTFIKVVHFVWRQAYLPQHSRLACNVHAFVSELVLKIQNCVENPVCCINLISWLKIKLLVKPVYAHIGFPFSEKKRWWSTNEGPVGCVCLSQMSACMFVCMHATSHACVIWYGVS